jgi:hypothetical protein
MGLGWEVETVNGVKILDHDGFRLGRENFRDVCAAARNRSGSFYEWREWEGGHLKGRGGAISEQAIRGYDVTSRRKVRRGTNGRMTGTRAPTSEHHGIASAHLETQRVR